VNQLARTIGIHVVAEGVEDADTIRMLADLPDTIGQGWYYGRPMPPDALVAWRSAHESAGLRG
jgi:sensor c-di-GMP phosphodiesterase-like protein